MSLDRACEVSKLKDDSGHVAGMKQFGLLLCVVLSAAAIAGSLPIQCSIVAVFLFAGPHNWFEARYFLTRLPPRWGKLRTYFSLGIGGVMLLSSSYIVLVFTASRWELWGWRLAYSVWGTCLVAWVVGLVMIRREQNPRREWPMTLPVGLVCISLLWAAPQYFNLLIVYLHPLIGLWILDSELSRHHPEWRTPYRICLCLLPVVVTALGWQLAGTVLSGADSQIAASIQKQAGSSVFPAQSASFLVAIHAFLELLHYGVWLVAIPLVAIGEAPWRIRNILLVRRSPVWLRWIGLFLVLSAVGVTLLWAGFVVDYAWMRDVYFTIAILHVLAEVPFLLRLL